MLWASTCALRSLLTLFWPRNFLRNLVLYFRLSPQTPHCHASRCWIPGESSHVHLSMRPELHALARAWVSAAEDTARRNAVSLNAEMEGRNIVVLVYYNFFIIPFVVPLTFPFWLRSLCASLRDTYILIQLIIILTRKVFPRWKWIIVPPFSSGNGRFPQIKITTQLWLVHTRPHHSSWLSTPSLALLTCSCSPTHWYPYVYASKSQRTAAAEEANMHIELYTVFNRPPMSGHANEHHHSIKLIKLINPEHNWPKFHKHYFGCTLVFYRSKTLIVNMHILSFTGTEFKFLDRIVKYNQSYCQFEKFKKVIGRLYIL